MMTIAARCALLTALLFAAACAQIPTGELAQQDTGTIERAQVAAAPEHSRISVLINGRCQGSKVSIPAGGQTPSTAGLSGPIGYKACLKKLQNQAAKNMTSDMMNRMKP